MRGLAADAFYLRRSRTRDEKIAAADVVTVDVGSAEGGCGVRIDEEHDDA
jgi:hypothetical protein